MRSLVLLMAGCAGSQPTPPAPPIVASDVPAIVAKLFVQGTTWTFPFKRRVATRDQTDPDDKGKETIETGTATCEVSFAGPRPHGRNARLTCSPALGQIPLEFTATKEGLWELSKASELDAKDRVLDEPPRKKAATTELSEGGSMTGVTSEAPGRWCFYFSGGGMGQGSGWMLCVRDGNLVGGRYSASGGEPDLIVIEFGEFDERTPI